MDKIVVDEEVQARKLVTQSKKGSWVDAVEQGQKVLTKYDVDVSIREGMGSVNVPQNVFVDTSPLWRTF